MKKIQQERYRLLRTIENLLEGPMVFLGFVWLALLICELIWGLSKPLEYLSLSIWGLFIIDFVAKFLLAPFKVAFLKKNWLTAVSLIIPALRIFRLIRVIRLLRGIRGIRLVRIVSSVNRGMKSLGSTMKRRAVGYVLLITIIVITAGNEFNPLTTEGRLLGFLIAVFGYTIFGYVTATFATYFIGRDAEEKDAPVAGAKQIDELKDLVLKLSDEIRELKTGR